MGPAVHPTAIVSPEAELGEGVEVGPFAFVGPRVSLGPRCHVGAHAVLEGPAEIGAGCRIHPYALIGSAPQDLKYKGEETRLVVGEGNTFREFVTVNRGTAGGGGVTRVGSGNFFMAHAHVAHDCQVGDGTIFANAATLAGHVEVGDGATVGAFSGVHQFCRVGRHAFIGGYTVVTQDALPFVKTVGNRAEAYGINTIGLERKGFSPESIQALKQAYRLLFQSKLNTSQAVERIDKELSAFDECRYLVSFIRSSTRGIVK
ncbi:MAG TPA: acyl-ACP--UDP-N-acetylglucosamine O-acyltransferase [Candidatus Polarisedimenticolia bacterium]|nr:acyl-ACP--UDP-N-acetylglucosamine O-acyltransferase [Candidatus Polarisedimenticolia bacterium]